MKPDSAFSANRLQANLSLILLCGIALALSIQPPVRIAALRSHAFSHPPNLFFFAFVLLFGLFAINRGVVIAANSPVHVLRRRLMLRCLGHISQGLLLLVPYFLYSHHFASVGGSGIVILILYVAVSSLFFCLVSFRLECKWRGNRPSGFVLRYGLYAALCLAPIGIGMSHGSLSVILSLSPIGLATRIMGGASAIELLVGFLVPSIGILWLLSRLGRIDGRYHAV